MSNSLVSSLRLKGAKLFNIFAVIGKGIVVILSKKAFTDKVSDSKFLSEDKISMAYHSLASLIGHLTFLLASLLTKVHR